MQSGKNLGVTSLTKGILKFRPEEQYMIGIHENMQTAKQILTIDGPPNKRTKFPPQERNETTPIQEAKPNMGAEMTKLLQQRIESLEHQINWDQHKVEYRGNQWNRFPYPNQGTSLNRSFCQLSDKDYLLVTLTLSKI